ncbi:P-loop NTPase [Candidatus Bathyarchaeota archaeon]|nr:P-loop NTPase [Candidatus Bathyarchaeota archaeon]
MVDPRLNIIDKRLAKIGKIIAVSSGKGGVGKSLIASTLALTLSRSGCKVGLLDLDFSSPSTHVILKIEGLYPKEEKGIVPPVAHGLMYMSIIYYSGDDPTPLRGADISNAIIELLAITQWGSLDFLVIDMPPGIGDATLDMIRLVKGINFLVVTTSSKVAFETVRKLIRLLRDLNVPIIGVVENMKMTDSSFIRENVEEFKVSFLGKIKFDYELENSIGDVNKLLETDFARSLEKLVSQRPEIKS